MRKLLSIIAFNLALILSLAMPVMASSMNDPGTISFGTGDSASYKVFENVRETGDMLFMAESYIYYANTDNLTYRAEEAFLFEVTNQTGNTTLLSTTANDYGDRMVSIYQTAAQVTLRGLTSNTTYGLRLRGNPIIFSSGTNNTANVTLSITDYVDYSLSDDNKNDMRNFCINIADDIEDYDSPATDYIVVVDGVRYLSSVKNPASSSTTTSNQTADSSTANITEWSGTTGTTIYLSGGGISGADIFLNGVPGISDFCPILFQSGSSAMTSSAPTSTGTYANSLTALAAWGAVTDNGITQLGNYFNVSHDFAGGMILFLLAAGLGIYIYKRTESGLVAILVIVGAVPAFGALLGLMQMALLFLGVIAIVILAGFFFFGKGAL